MPLVKKNDVLEWKRRTPRQTLTRFILLLVAIVAVLVSWSFISAETTWEFVKDAPRQIQDFLSRMFPPDIKYFGKILPALWDTITISVFGTGIAVVLSFFLAILAAKNTSPHPAVRLVVLTIIVASRSVNSMIWAMILVQLVGPGLFYLIVI